MTRDNGHIVVSQRDLSRETDRYSTQWIVTQKTPEEVAAYIEAKYGKLPEPTRATRKPPHYSDGLNHSTYTKEKSTGLSDAKIAAKYGISKATLSGRRKRWALNPQ